MDIGWSELLIVGIVALIVIGPKDLPGMFRELGRFTAKLRAMGREFSRAMEDAARETGVKDVADDLRKVANPKTMGLDAVKSAADKFEKWDPLKNAAKPTQPLPQRPLTPPPMPATPAATALGPETAALAEKAAARKAASAEKAASLRAAKAAAAAATPVATVADAAPAPAPTPKRGGRVRKIAAADPGAEA